MNRLDELHRRHAAAEEGGGADRRARQHQEGKLSARERIELLLDEGSFEELDKLVTHRCRDFGMGDQIVPGDGFVTGYGRIDGRLVYVFAQDFTVLGGSLSEANALKICKMMDLALKTGAPVIGLNDSGGARIQEGVVSLAGYADIFLRNTLASGVVPQISAIMGPCAGRSGLLAGDHRFRLHGEPDQLYVRDRSRRTQDRHPRRCHQGRPGRRDDPQRHQRRGPFQRARRRGVPAHDSRVDELPAAEQPRRPAAPRHHDSPERADAALDSIVPAESNLPYDIKDVIHRVVDDGEFFEVHEHWAKNLVIGFAHMDGRPSASSPINRHFWPAAWISIRA
jgi:propionyl-CoA carboxylase beta chain